MACEGAFERAFEGTLEGGFEDGFEGACICRYNLLVLLTSDKEHSTVIFLKIVVGFDKNSSFSQ